MIERLLERVRLGEAEYVALDSDPEHLPIAARRLEAWAAEHGAVWTAGADDTWDIDHEGTQLKIRWVRASLFADALPEGPFDVLLAHAFLDLVDLDRALPRLLPRLRPGGTFLFTLNFDGLTAFLPEDEPALDRSIVEGYHATMDARRDGDRPSGSSRTGQVLLAELPRRGAEVLAAGASDWIIFAGRDGYDRDEEIVLETMVGFVEASLGREPAIDPSSLSRWVARRRRQIESGELIFLAHQIDVLGRMP
jgi:SAM-dependent methyltransferase